MEQQAPPSTVTINASLVEKIRIQEDLGRFE